MPMRVLSMLAALSLSAAVALAGQSSNPPWFPSLMAFEHHIPPNLVVAPRASHNTLDLSMRYPHHVFLRANGI